MQCLLFRVHGHKVSGTIVVLSGLKSRFHSCCRAGQKGESVFGPPHPLSIACMFSSHMGFGCIFLFLPVEVGIPFVDQQSLCKLDVDCHIGFSTWRGFKHSIDR